MAMTEIIKVRGKRGVAILANYAGSLMDAALSAMMLRAFDCKAKVFPIGVQNLVKFLEQQGKEFGQIFIINLPFRDEERAIAVLKELKAAGVRVEGAANCYVRSRGALSRKVHDLGLFEYITPDGSDLYLGREIKSRFGVDVEDLNGIGDFLFGERYCVSDVSIVQSIHAGLWFLDKYGRSDIYGLAIESLAKKQYKPTEWDEELSKAVEHYKRFRHRVISGESSAMEELREKIQRVSRFPDARVMILGETGTGKETVAMQIHYASERSKRKFVSFNCATVNSDLIESRFFGHEKGAFTSADKQKTGLFEEANGGTLFLDEIGELKLEAQGVLLRVLENGVIMPVGSNREIPVDVRLVTATNRDLPTMVKEGKFRADLYQRLCVVQIKVPPLREHKEDIPAIVSAWADSQMRPNGKRFHEPTEEQVAMLADYDYPGNVRELLNLLDRSLILGETDFAKLLQEHRQMNSGMFSEPVCGIGAKLTKVKTSRGWIDVDKMDVSTLEDAMRRYVGMVYRKCGENLTEAAKVLDVSRNTVRKYLG